MGYMGAAWATLVCYVAMAAASYLLGRRYYPAPYQVTRVFGYIGLGLLLYFTDRQLLANASVPPFLSGSILLAVYMIVAYVADGRRLLQWRG